MIWSKLTSTGLLARAVSRMTRLVRRIKAVGAASRTRFRDRTRAAGRRVRFIAAHLRLRGGQAREQAQAAVARITVVVNGTARWSSIMVYKPVSCSSSLYASTVASSIMASSVAFRFDGIGSG